jgi:hypothetical protein
MPLPAALHIVQVMKQEWGGLGGDAPDERAYPEPIERNEDAVECAGVVVQRSSGQDEKVGFYRTEGASADDDELTLFDPVTGIKKLSELSDVLTGHAAIDDPVHNIAETCEAVITRSGGKLATQTIRDQSDTPLIRKWEYTRSGGKMSQIVERQYDGSGAEIVTLTTVINRDGNGKYDGFTMTRA